MEQEQKSNMPEVHGPWLHVSFEPPYKPTYRIVEVLLFISVGLNVGIAFTNLAHTAFGMHRANVGSFAVVGIVAALQAVFSLYQNRQLRKRHEKLKREAVTLQPSEGKEVVKEWTN
jgi:hypothetical protein